MGRSPCCDDNGLKKGPWTPEEDQKLVDYIQKHGHGSWRALPKLAGRYMASHLFLVFHSLATTQRVCILTTLFLLLLHRWSAIATHLPGRTDNEIKNFWNTHLKKKLIQMGFDPMTHQPRTDLFASLPHLIALANLKDLVDNHPLDEHAMRLQAEAVQLAKLQYLQCLVQSAASVASNSSSTYGQNGITDVEVLNLLNSSNPAVKEAAVLNSLAQLENQASSYPIGFAATQPLHHTSLLPPLSDPQVPFSYQPSLNNEMGQASSLASMVSLGDPSDSTWLLPSPPLTLPTVTETTTSNPGDASSTTSSYGAGGTSSYWPELFFEDPIMHEIS
ncbi:hypothetical protein Tsubulata_035857 [Turnera subulata]|uniref:Transcription factor MYB39 n=1 Tax=Turnera subulata TaxID=218843 RepID=A0A9Q0JNP8_9ROSI|nr:hypothetical protein Tsubulata_035857 [Turnera subulata]